MGNYLDKWKTLFPEVVGGTKRPLEAISDQEEFNTNGFPQFIAQDPVRYDLQNAFLKQFLSNDAWLWVKQQQANQALDKHKGDAQAHLNGISGNAASATKLRTPRALNLSGAVTADAANFDGTADATINVKTLDASKLKGTASVSTTGNAATATKLATARTIALSGNASGSATFDGSGNATINVTVSESAHAAKATQDVNGRAFTDANAYMHISKLADGTDFNNVKTTGVYACSNDNYPNRPLSSWGVLRVYYISDNYKQEYIPGNRNEVWVRYFTGSSWNAWSKVTASTADTCTGNAATASKLASPRTLSLTGKAAGSTSFDGSANASINVTSVNADTASKLSTARKINITGNATGAAAFDGSADANISVTVNESKHAAAADNADKLGGYPLNDKSQGVNYGTVPKINNDGVMEVGRYIDWHVVNGGAEDYSARWEVLNNGTVNVGTINGALNGNSATATKLQTPRTISLTGNASGSANFDGSGNISINTNVNNATNADTVDGVHAGSMFYNKGNWTADNWATMGTYQVNGNPPSSNSYGWGQVISSSTIDGRFQLYASDNYGGDGRLHYRTGWDSDKHDWNTILDSENYNNFAPTKTGSGASGTWPISITGNAATATTATTATAADRATQVIATAPNGGGLDVIHAVMASDDAMRIRIYGGENDGALEIATGDDGNEPIYVRQYFDGGIDNFTKVARTAAILDSNGNTSFPGTVTAPTFSGTATNADKVDGYHASDIIGKIYPVGSIYMSMSATNPATLFGVGTWERISQGRMLLGADDSTYKAGATGGEAAHTLTVNEMPAHSHGISNSGDHTHFVYGSDNRNGAGYAGDGIDTDGNSHFGDRNNRYTTSSAGAHTHTIDNAGGGAAHNNMPPYLVCYIWQRTA